MDTCEHLTQGARYQIYDLRETGLFYVCEGETVYSESCSVLVGSLKCFCLRTGLVV